MTEKEILIAFLAKTLNMTTEQIAPLLYKIGDDGVVTDQISEGALLELSRLDSERVAKLKPNTKEFFDNGYKKAQAEVAAEWEKALRTEFGVDPEGQLKGKSLTDAVKAAMAGEGMKPDKVKTSAEYLALEKTAREKEEAIKAQYEEQIRGLQGKWEKDKTWGEVSAAIRQRLRSLNPVLPADQAKQDRMIELFLQEFKAYEYQRDDNGFLPLKDGARIENAHGHARNLDDLVKERAEWVFDFQQQSAAGNAGNQNSGQGNRVNTSFTGENDFISQYNKADDASKVALAAAWEAQQAK